MRECKEVTQRRFDGRSCLAIPVAAEDSVAVVCQLWKSKGTVEVRNASRTIVLQQCDGLARMNDEEIAVAAAPIPRRCTPTTRASVGKKRAQWMLVKRVSFHGYDRYSETSFTPAEMGNSHAVIQRSSLSLPAFRMIALFLLEPQAVNVMRGITRLR